MEHIMSEAEKAKFPGVFVRHKGHKDSASHMKGDMDLKSDCDMDSPKSNQSEEFAISSCTSSCSVITSTAQNAPQISSMSSECGMTMSDSEGMSSTDGLDTNRSEMAKLRRSKRKKSKDKTAEENAALDPVRYKTKMCKNWQMQEKCPYGPRCLFAHGSKEMRTYTVNHNAISTACTSSSPERQFYALGHFPNFMPVPYNGESEGSQANSVQGEELEAPEPTSKTDGQYTHSPYSSIIMEPSVQVADVPRSILGPINDPYFFPHRSFHPQVPVFPQLPFPPECAMYAPQFPNLAPYNNLYPTSFYQPVR